MTQHKIKFNELLEAISLDDVNKNPGTEEVSVMLGRFQPCTAAHISIIDDAYKKYGNTVVVAVVKSSNDKSPFPFKLISEILQKSTKSKIKVIELKTGFIGDFISPLRDEGMEPTILLAGTDRVKSYNGQIKRYKDTFNLNLEVKETKRTADDISASKVRQSIVDDDLETFKSMTAKGTWKYFDKLKKYMK